MNNIWLGCVKINVLFQNFNFFSRPGICIFLIPYVFQVFSKRTNSALTLRDSMSNKWQTLGRRSLSSSREDVSTWNSSWASCGGAKWDRNTDWVLTSKATWKTRPQGDSTHLLFKGVDVPPVQSEDVQQAPGIQNVLVPWLMAGQGCGSNLHWSCLPYYYLSMPRMDK